MTLFRPVVAFVVIVLALVSLPAGSAVAARGEPQKQLIPADQARARAMLLKKSDLARGFKATRSSGDDDEDDFYCKAGDQSDLTLSGEAESPGFETDLLLLSSGAQIYATLAEAEASWQRGTSAASLKCLRDGLRRVIRKQGMRFVSFARVPFPALAQGTYAFRLVSTLKGVRAYFDFVVLRHGRAHATLFVLGIGSPVPQTERAGIARVLTKRMAAAMRGDAALEPQG